MFCPKCESEYRQGSNVLRLRRAARSGAAAEDHAKGLVALTEETSSRMLGDLVERLEKAAVPSVIEAGTALSMLLDDELS